MNLTVARNIFSAGVIAAFLQSGSAIAQATPQPLGVQDVLTMRTFQMFAPIVISADGHQVAYTLKRPKSVGALGPETSSAQSAGFSTGATEIWLTDLQTGESRNITGEQGSSWGTAWSPDGQSLALYSNRDGMARLWLWERQTKSLRRVSDIPIFPGYDASELQWTPDGRQVLVRVHAEQASENDAGASTALPSKSAQDNRGRPTVRVFNSTGTSADPPVRQVLRKRSRNDLALIDVASGRAQRITKGTDPYTVQISPDGRFVAFMDDSGEFAPGSFTKLLDLKLIALADGEVRTLVKGIRMGGNNFDRNDWSWSPDSRWLAYRDTIADAEIYDAASWVSNAFLVSLDGKVRALTAPSQPKFRGMPIWDDRGQFLYFFTADEIWRISAHDGGARAMARLPGKTLKTLITASPNRDRLWTVDGGASVTAVAASASKSGPMMGFYRVRLESGKVTTLLEEQKRYVVDEYNVVDNVLASPRTRQVVYVAEDARRPKDLWLLSGELRQPRQLSRLNPSIDAADSMGQQLLVDWTGRDGATHTGVLLLPSDYRRGRRYPLVTHAYPMTPLQFSNYFGLIGGAQEMHYYNMQLLATRGYATLLAGAPIQPGEPMKAVADWALPGIDKVIELGIADADRVGLLGTSAGGYAVLSLIVQSTRFKAAVEHVGPGNLLSGYGTGMSKATGYSHGQFNAENGFGMAGHPWEAREQYIRNSPWFFLDKVTTPLLILHGADDDAVFISQPNELFVGLRRLGKKVQYALYEGEAHAFASLANQIDATNRYLDWFDNHLKGNTAATAQ